MEVCECLDLSSSHHLMGPADNLAAGLEVLLYTLGLVFRCFQLALGFISYFFSSV